MQELLERLRKFDALRDTPGDGRGDNVFVRVVPRQKPELAPSVFFDRLPAPVREALAGLGIRALYSYQAEAINRILAGEDVVLEAPTAGGKTLCFNIPIVIRLLADPAAHVLMVHPMKALSNDQRRQFEELAAPLSKSAKRPFESWVFDGDLEPEYRRLLKSQPPSVLFTNPEMLHASFLGWREQWQNFLANLRIVVLDEIHEYRGYFGTNVALLLRRFFAKLALMGVRPQVVLATATCGNAEEHAFRLTGRRCRVVRASSAMQPERHFAFITPNIPDFKFHEIYRIRIARAALACAANGQSTIVFCPSRKFAEETAIRAKRDASDFGLDPEAIAPYRSGYGADLRRDIESGLRDGRFRIVFSTNALEIGVDIGRLDVCILAGFPDSVLSAWQRIGRVGRSWEKTAYILFYALNNPFDRFFASNIDAFLSKPLDEILIGIDNEELMAKHLPYLVYECGSQWSPALKEQLGTAFYQFASAKMAGKTPVVTYPPNYQRLSIRGGSSDMYALIYKGKELGHISGTHLFREAFVGAIYNHFGKQYRVVAHGAGEVVLDDAEPHLRTEGIFFTVTQGAELVSGIRYGDSLAACYGRLNVFENFVGYRLIDTRTGEVVDEERSQLARSSSVRGFWLEVLDTELIRRTNGQESLFGVEQLLRVGVPFVVACDRHDLGSWTVSRPPTVYLYETVPGGIGIAEKALEVWPKVLEAAINLTERCPCRRGCPSCLVPPHLPPGQEEPRKEPTIAMGRRLLQVALRGSTERFDPSTHSWVPVD
ncbi:MAG: DEAD/DEAH box helicase [Acidobacteriota bacterium]